MIRLLFTLVSLFVCLFSEANPLYTSQYYLHNTGQFGGTAGVDINMEDAWELVSGSPYITVAVIDYGGVQKNHEDLQGVVLDGYSYGLPTGLGAPNDLTNSKQAHGTECAGIIAALDNTIGIKGIANGWDKIGKFAVRKWPRTIDNQRKIK